MRKAAVALILILTVALFSGCSASVTGKLITEEKDFTDFTKVDVEGAFDIEIIKANSFSVTVSGDEGFFDYIAVEKEGDTLKISLDPRHTFTDFTLVAKTLKAKVAMPALRRLRLSGASTGTIQGFSSSDDFSIEVSGASALDMDDIKTSDAEFEISGASKVAGNIEAGDIEFKVSGASGVELEGSADNTAIEASGASNVNLADFPLNNADVKLSGASEATVNVKGRLDSVLSAASRLYFHGNPTIGNMEVSGASTIKHK
jgi:hypothetical protein